MKLLRNTGTERVVDLVRPWLRKGTQVDLVTPTFSLFAFGELLDDLGQLAKARLVLPPPGEDLALLGSPADRAARNRLQTRWLARRCAAWIEQKVDLRSAQGKVPQGAIVVRNQTADPEQVVLGSFSFSTDGLGITPGNPLSLIQASETPEESRLLCAWFDAQWAALQQDQAGRRQLIQHLQALAAHRDPFTVYTLVLHHLFAGRGDDMDEDRIVKSATGIRYAKLPGWFHVPTPLGSYNPDWAVLIDTEEGERLYFVVETKSELFLEGLRDQGRLKIECGKVHFGALQVREAPARYVVARTVDDVLNSAHHR